MFRSIRWGCVAVILSALPFASAESPSGDSAQFERLQNKLADVADAVRPCVVAIRADRHIDIGDGDGDEPAMPDDETHRRLREHVFPAVGSGFIVDPDGMILTNEHVVHSAEPKNIECVLADGRTYTVQGITSDPRSDLAVLKIDQKNLKTAELGDLRTVRQGHFAIVMGNPFGSATENYGRSAMSFGIISALGQDLTQKLDLSQQRYYGNLIQTDARINPGNSGGPLLNLAGEVIGITTAISTRSGSSEGVGYAISIDERTKEIISHLIRGEEIEYGFIGVRLNKPSKDDLKDTGYTGSGGALVMEVELGTPAAGMLLANDIVVEYGKTPIEDVDQLIRLVGSSRVGKQVEIKLYRNNKPMIVSVTPAHKSVLKGVHIDAPFAWWRGMRLVDASSDVRQTFKLPAGVDGVVVTQVESNGPADKAGLKPGQVIRRIGPEPVKGLNRLRELTPKLSGPIQVQVVPDNTEITLP